MDKNLECLRKRRINFALQSLDNNNKEKVINDY